MRNPITVKQLGNYLKSEILSDPFLRNVLIIGEVSNLSIKKYTYFSLNEDNESISCVFFDNYYSLKEGDKIIVRGSVNLFLRDSKYQIKIEEIYPVGIGENIIELQKLIDKLQKKGYFDKKKKEILKFPKKIGLITGLDSAAYFDFIKVFNDNHYDAEIFFYPTLVQGKYADLDIIKALNYLDTLSLDVIVLTRGGGSKQDLSIFNSEIIADTIFNLSTPLISAIGHEIDNSITDLISDIRVQTPTKAGEYIVSEFVKSLNLYHLLNKNIDYSINNIIKNKIFDLEKYKANIELKNPIYLLKSEKNNIDILMNKINLRINSLISDKIATVYELSGEISKKYSNKLKKEQFLIKDENNIFVDIDDLTIGENYYIFNEYNRYKILIEEKYDRE